MTGVVIRGGGVAAYGCAHLLRAAGFQVVMERTDRPRLPAVMLSERTQALFKDAFDRGDLFRDLPRIGKRVVAWGPNAQPLALSHSAVVVSEQLLLERLQPKLVLDHRPAGEETNWTIVASRPLPTDAVEHKFGARMATAIHVSQKDGSDPAACWIESIESGWLFLLPDAPGSGWLLAAGGAAESLLERSRLIVKQIERLGGPEAQFPAYPRIAWPLCGCGWLACGTAALAFDPLCGDGTGHALREAILASAVVRAVAKGAKPDDVLAHYQARLMAGFKRHLELCRGFYISGRSGPWWDSELDAVHRGLEWCRCQAGQGTEFRYRLSGFELRALG